MPSANVPRGTLIYTVLSVSGRKVLMVVKGEVIGYQVFQSGAVQLFVKCSAQSNDKIKEFGSVVRAFWRAKGTYSFDNPPDLLGATVVAFVGRNESGILDLTLKGGGR